MPGHGTKVVMKKFANCYGIVNEVSSRSLFALVKLREFDTLNTNEGLLYGAAVPGSPSLNVDP
jgi:hypothetical protein